MPPAPAHVQVSNAWKFFKATFKVVVALTILVLLTGIAVSNLPKDFREKIGEKIGIDLADQPTAPPVVNVTVDNKDVAEALKQLDETLKAMKTSEPTDLSPLVVAIEKLSAQKAPVVNIDQSELVQAVRELKIAAPSVNINQDKVVAALEKIEAALRPADPVVATAPADPVPTPVADPVPAPIVDPAVATAPADPVVASAPPAEITLPPADEDIVVPAGEIDSAKLEARLGAIETEQARINGEVAEIRSRTELGNMESAEHANQLAAHSAALAAIRDALAAGAQSPQAVASPPVSAPKPVGNGTLAEVQDCYERTLAVEMGARRLPEGHKFRIRGEAKISALQNQWAQIDSLAKQGRAGEAVALARSGPLYWSEGR